MSALANLNAATEVDFINELGGIYEHSPWVAAQVAGKRPFGSTEELRLAMKRAVDGATAEQKMALICAHPDLAGKLARQGALTEESTREQAGLGLDRLSEEEYELFSRQNARYRERFGFPFIICARNTTRQGVLDAFEARLHNAREEEISEALAQIHEIARLRMG